jgi:hypothetical protein
MSAAIMLAFALSHAAVWVISRGQKKEEVKSARWEGFLKGYRLCAVASATIPKEVK